MTDNTGMIADVVADGVTTITQYDGHPLLNLTHDPKLNMLDADVFKERVGQIFTMVANSLKKSYGPYGASAILENHPFHHVTKDGFSIMKRLAFSKEYTLVDDAIKDLICEPCSRLNNSVGDGTTTAIIAVEAIYNQFMSSKEELENRDFAPRDLLKAYNTVRDEILTALNDEITQVNMKSHNEMVDTMKNIAYISSNGDDEITDMVASLYDELDCQLISVENALDGITKKNVIEGYKFDAILKDIMYVNKDDRTGEYSSVDVLLFDYKIGQDVFKEILYPLNERCRAVGRKLIVIAPMYDEIAIMNASRKLKSEYQQTGDVNLILMAGNISGKDNRAMYDDLALMLNTVIINRGLSADIMEKIKSGSKIDELIDINRRGIKDINVFVNGGWTVDNGEIPEDKLVSVDESAIRAGYAGKCVLGFEKNKGSVFNDLHYDEEMYKKTLKEVEYSLNQSKAKSEALGSLNIEAITLQNRLYKLRMKLGTIEVGGTSILSTEMLRDAVDDTVKATASAYENGILPGCSVGTLKAIWKLITGKYNEYPEDEISFLEWRIVRIIFNGFIDVYKTLLESRFGTKLMGFVTSLEPVEVLNLDTDENAMDTAQLELVAQIHGALTDEERLSKMAESLPFTLESSDVALLDENINLLTYFAKMYVNDSGHYYFGFTADTLLIALSILRDEAFDLITKSYNKSIVNSARTDREVLIASSDLISLLITGNQFVMAGE